MQQPISIYLLPSYTRLDISNSETIEINMGGLRLLSLEDRTVSYSNSVKLPRTANNEQALGFVGVVPKTYRTLSFDIIIYQSLFNRKATLKIKSFDLKNYSCEIIYGSVYAKLKETKAFDFRQSQFPFLPLIEGRIEKSVVPTIANINRYGHILTHSKIQVTPVGITPVVHNDDFFYASTNMMILPTNQVDADDVSIDPKGLCILISDYLNIIAAHIGKDIDASLITDASFEDTALFCPFQKRTISDLPIDDPDFETQYLYRSYTAPQVDKSTITAADVLKTLSQIFFFDILETETALIFQPVAPKLQSDGILIETLKSKGITYTTDLSGKNHIVYKIIDTDLVGKLYGSDTIISNGSGEKTLMEVGCTIPQYIPQAAPNEDVIAADLYNERCVDAVVIGKVTDEVHMVFFTYGEIPNISGIQPWNVSAPTEPATTYPNASRFDTLSMSGYYSDSIGSTIANPVVIDADGYLSPLQSDSITDGRVIRSVALGGKFFVEDMKYNLTTGKAVLKLIKIK